MIFGECPYCDQAIAHMVPDGVKLPVMLKSECGNCGEEYWTKMTRIDPESYTRDMVEVDEENHSVKLKEVK